MPRERVKHGKRFVTTVRNLDTTNQDPTPEDGILRELYIGDTLEENERILEEPSLDVHWDRDAAHVQIAFDAPTDWWKRFMSARENDELVTASSVFTDSFTRKEINDMIRTLRRARDSAYGADA